MNYKKGFWLTCLVTVAAAVVISLLLFSKLVKKKKKTSTTSDAGNDISSASMNSSSSSPTSSAPPTVATGWDYEVFLSFRGKDTRTSFTDFLYHDLVDAGIRTFRDDDELRVGEEIGPELLKAIEHSKISIPIFSKDYASSKWCLRELAHMVECKKSMGQMILPIFFDVEPSDVRHQTGSYEKAFRQHKKKSLDDKTVEGWKEALTEVGTLKGWEVKNVADGHQGKLIKIVVSTVWGELKKNSMVVTDYLVGIDDHVEEIMRLLNVDSSDVRIVGIHGMGGIGKTTIAKVIYNQLSEHFKCRSFLADVREMSQQSKGLVSLQNQLISDILKQKSLDIRNFDEGINIIKDRFCDKKVLIVLDDVDQRFQIDALTGKRGPFGSGSRIIVTTRDKDVLNEEDLTYEPKEMDPDQSLQLFSKHAFRKDYPPEDYHSLSRDVVFTTAGLPLALEIIGSFLSGKGRAVWEDTLKKLKKIPNDQVQKKLRISYEVLDYEQQQIFLDIACLFIGVDKRIAVYMWDDCDFFPEYGIEVLVLRSLVKIGDGNVLRMHDQLRDLGREIVRQENFKNPGKRSRLWSHAEALDVLERLMGTEKVEALCLDFGFGSQEYSFANEAFEKLSNLRFLQLGNSNLAGDFKRLLSELRWLRWNGCPRNFTPTNFHLKNLVILDLSWSEVSESWEGWSQIKMLEKLKVLNLTGCVYLTRTPDFAAYATLERLILEDCPRLVQISSSIGHLKLVLDIAFDYSGINELPDSIESLVKLRRLSLRNCSSFRKLPESIGKLESLIELHLQSTDITEIPDAIGNLKELRVLDIKNSRIMKLPKSIGMLEKLEEIDASDCYYLEGELASNIGRLSSLRNLRLGHTKIRSIPRSICELSHLQTLDLAHCKWLQSLPELPSSLTSLHVTCVSMETFPNLSNLINLKELSFFVCSKLVEIPRGIEKLSKLEALFLVDTCSIRTLPTEIGALSHLKELNVQSCKKLQRFPVLPSSLFKLYLQDCESMESLPDLSNLKMLSELMLGQCYELTEIQGLGKLELLTSLDVSECEKLHKLDGLEQLASLRFLNTSGCKSLERLPDLSNLHKLRELFTLDCEKLIEIQGLDRLVSLEYLDMKWCTSLERLPDLSNLKYLKNLQICGCGKLSEIRGLEELKALKYLNISGCRSLEKLPDLSNLEELKELLARNCKNLTEILGLEKLKSLAILEISGCKSLEKLPDLSNIKEVHR